jgi:probable F420-dependent oxidoreductase
MTTKRGFRFGMLAARTAERRAWQETARKIEAAGLSTILLTDHLGDDRLAPLPALVSAAEAAPSLRLGTIVLNNDLRHPAVLAKDVATVDILSDGRLELGLGAGWEIEDYTRAGLPFDRAGVRIARLEESLEILDALFTGDTVSYTGTHYRISDFPAVPQPAQRPRPPFLVGGGGKRLLSVAARRADIVGIHIRARTDGKGQDWSSAVVEDVEQKVGWVREAAGERFTQLELCQNLFAVIVTDDQRAVAGQMTTRFGLSADEILASPYFLIGTVDQIVEKLRANRERFGISYIIAPDVFLDALTPIVARLAGT